MDELPEDEVNEEELMDGKVGGALLDLKSRLSRFFVAVPSR